MSLGFYYAMGALFPVIMDTFRVSRAEAAIVQSIYGTFMDCGGIVFGLITSKFGTVKTTVASSIITSLSLVAAFWTTSLQYLAATSVSAACGLGMAFIASTVGVREYFEGTSSVVSLALMSSSSGMTGVALTYLFRYLSYTYGLRGTCLIMGGFQLNSGALCFLWRRVKTERTEPCIDIERTTEEEEIKDTGSNFAPDNFPKDGELHLQQRTNIEHISMNRKNGIVNAGYSLEEDSDRISMNGRLEKSNKTYNCQRRIASPRDGQKIIDRAIERSPIVKTKLKYLLSNKVFIVTAIGELMCMNAFLQYVMFLLDMYSDRGYSNKQGTTGLTIMNIAGIIGRCSPAVIANCPFYNTFLLPVLSTTLASIAMFLISMADNITLYYVLSLVIGFGFGICVSVIVVSVSELVEKEYLAEAVGFILSAIGLFSLVGGPFTGFLRDSTGSYTLSHILTSVFTGIGSSMFLVAAYMQRTQRKQMEDKKRDSIHYITKF